jgi:outer membrane protein OmpA-like peptidoglycan-associated protein/tetratricopeptide (TPR) repeat protein
MRFRLPLLLLCTVFALGAKAQSGQLTKADRLYDRYAFHEAAEVYEKALARTDAGDPAFATAALRLAECYRLTNRFDEAAAWYGRVVGQRAVEPIYRFRYAQMLLSAGQCTEAEFWFRRYAEDRPEDGRGPRFEKACEELSGLYADDGRYTIEPLPVNSPYADFGPAFFDGGLVFLSARPDGRAGGKVHGWSGEPFLDYYHTAPTEDGFREATHFGGAALNSRHHEGPLVFSANGQRVFFTRNNEVSASIKENDARTVRLKIYTAERAGDERWKAIRELDFNSGDFSNAAPALGRDGDVLVFSSTRPGGFGGADLYLSRWRNGEWTRPVNLGSGVNTEGDEVFPFLHEDGTLYFASDGHAGLGGLDLFAAEPDPARARDALVAAGDWTADPADSARQALGVWLPARNMGWALNSRWDDFGLVWDAEREHGYFASNRPGGAGGDDLYFMRHHWVRIEGEVVDALTGEALPYAEVRVTGAPAEKRVRGNDAGRFALDLPRETALAFTGHAEGYASASVEAVGRHGAPNKVRLELQPEGIPVRLRVVDAETGRPLAGARLTLGNECSGAENEALSDRDGSMAVTLSRGCDYRWTGRLDGYADAVLPVSKEAFAGLPEAVFTLELDPLAAGLTVELQHIYYDYDEHYIREDAVTDLIALAELMADNPQVTIELGSHTDARGSAEYNERLSQRRADAAVAYLVKLGVPAARVTAKGYGESRPRNRCTDGVDCSDAEHQANRRTEFRVTGLDFPLESEDAERIPVNTGRRAR